MIRRFIKRVLGGGGGLRKIPRGKHGVARDQISACALRTTDLLQKEGYAAFVVGGAVRDLLLGKAPKDFDVATDATPEEVRQLFRRSRIIGRRFRIVHVMCGQDLVEVTTFRGPAGEEEDDEDRRADDETGRLLRDNVFGSMEEDAARRDFTVNALFYDPHTEEIWDYHDGYADLKKGVLRMIGDPARRYREDPVRMLRAARFAAKLDFHIDPKTRAPIAQLADLLAHVPSSRLFDEMLKLLLSGHALRGLHQLRAEGLHKGLLPLLDVILEQEHGERFVTVALKNTDQRIQQDKPSSPGFLFACLLWPMVRPAWARRQEQGLKPLPALMEAMDEILAEQENQLAIPRRYEGNIKEIWAMQPRFQQRAGVRPFRLLEQARFRAAYDFLLLRCESGELAADLGDWWTRFQEADHHEREAMLVKDEAAPKKRRRRPRKPRSEIPPPAEA
jgi:poly(A) polymerase